MKMIRKSLLVMNMGILIIVFIPLGCNRPKDYSNVSQITPEQSFMANKFEEDFMGRIVVAANERGVVLTVEACEELLGLIRAGSKRLANENHGKGPSQEQMMIAENNLTSLIKALIYDQTPSNAAFGEPVTLNAYAFDVLEYICPLYPFC